MRSVRCVSTNAKKFINMQEDCSVQMGPAQEDALFCHQYYSVTDEPPVITGRLYCELCIMSSALNVSSLDRLKYGSQVKVQSGHLHRYIKVF